MLVQCLGSSLCSIKGYYYYYYYTLGIGLKNISIVITVA